MNVAIVGSRNWTDEQAIINTMNELVKETLIDHIVSGGATGADTIGENWATLAGIPVVIHYPDWNRYGKSAGYKRNELIVGDADLVMAFQINGSRGTQHTIDIARGRGVEVRVFDGSVLHTR